MTNLKSISIIRILFFGSFWILIDQPRYVEWWLNVPSEFWHPQGATLIPLNHEQWKTLIIYLIPIWRVTFFCSLTGLLYKYSAKINAICGLLILNFTHSFGAVPHNQMPLLIVVFILAFAPAQYFFSLDALFSKSLKPDQMREHQSRWAHFNAKLILCLVYFSAGISKVINGGWEWISGDSVRNYMVSAFVNFPDLNEWARLKAFNLYIVEHQGLSHVLAFLTVAVELSAPLALLGGRFSLIILFCLFALQVGAYFFVYVNFSVYGALFLIWLPTMYLVLTKNFKMRKLAV